MSIANERSEMRLKNDRSDLSDGISFRPVATHRHYSSFSWLLCSAAVTRLHVSCVNTTFRKYIFKWTPWVDLSVDVHIFMSYRKLLPRFHFMAILLAMVIRYMDWIHINALLRWQQQLRRNYSPHTTHHTLSNHRRKGETLANEFSHLMTEKPIAHDDGKINKFVAGCVRKKKTRKNSTQRKMRRNK